MIFTIEQTIALVMLPITILGYIFMRNKYKPDISCIVTPRGKTYALATITIYNPGNEQFTITKINAKTGKDEIKVANASEVNADTGFRHSLRKNKSIEPNILAVGGQSTEYHFFVVSETSMVGLNLIIEICTSASLFSMAARKKTITTKYKI